MMAGTSLNTNKGVKISDKGPLRKIEYIEKHGNTLFEGDYAILECGHSQYGYGAFKMRCTSCKKEKAPNKEA